MADDYVYDAVRTPRGKGKKAGSLNEVPAVRLAAKTLESLRDRNVLASGTLGDSILGGLYPVAGHGYERRWPAAFGAVRAMNNR